MTLTLHEHPFAAYCWKALVALFERDVPFERHFVGGEADRARLGELWPMATIPVLVDDAAGLTPPESTTIVEYLDGHGDAPVLLPSRTGGWATGTVVGPRVRRARHDADAEDRR
jgi:glutathione S-transferase